MTAEWKEVINPVLGSFLAFAPNTVGIEQGPSEAREQTAVHRQLVSRCPQQAQQCPP